MDNHDGSALGPALADAEARGIKPEVLLGDSHYGSEEDLGEAAVRGVEVVRGRASVGYRVFLRALGLNIHRESAHRAAS